MCFEQIKYPIIISNKASRFLSMPANRAFCQLQKKTATKHNFSLIVYSCCRTIIELVRHAMLWLTACRLPVECAFDSIITSRRTDCSSSRSGGCVDDVCSTDTMTSYRRPLGCRRIVTTVTRGRVTDGRTDGRRAYHVLHVRDVVIGSGCCLRQPAGSVA